MKRISKFIVLLLISISIFGCGTSGKQKHKDSSVLTMKIAYVMMASSNQIDSMCIADTLPLLSNWAKTTFIDYEENSVIEKKVYIKEYPSGREHMYIVTGNHEPYFVTKRITEFN